MTQVINPIAPNDVLGGSFRISYHTYGQKQINHESLICTQTLQMISLNFFGISDWDAYTNIYWVFEISNTCPNWWK